jgi:hypothetical protein
MKHFLREYAGNDVLAGIINDVAISALPSKADAKGDHIYQAPNQLFYRVLLVKHSLYGNRRRDFTFNLIKTLDKVRGGKAETTTLVAGIVLGSKYRSLFIEPNAKYELKSLKKLALEDAAVVVLNLLQDIERINADAASDGLADYTALQALLGDTQEIKDLFERWWTVYPPMEKAAKQFIGGINKENFENFISCYKTFVHVSRSNNTIFLLECLRVYRDRLDNP